jgi:LmbE family N-acetylglucosaminyl deacetylase
MATVVAFHAHPDDEVLLTGGTAAKLAAEGHRVVLVVACDGAVGAPRELAIQVFGVLHRVPGLVSRYTAAEARNVGTLRAAITHGVNVRRYAGRKQAALAAHRSPVSGKGRAGRLFRLAVALPVPVFALLAGREWYAEPGAAPGPVLDDILRSRAG